MRGQGSLYQPKNGRGERQDTFWFKFGYRGKVYTGSTGTTVKRDAYEVLRTKIGQVKTGLLTTNPSKVTVGTLKGLVVTQYE